MASCRRQAGDSASDNCAEEVAPRSVIEGSAEMQANHGTGIRGSGLSEKAGFNSYCLQEYSGRVFYERNSRLRLLPLKANH
jgi:hypothetical protein